MTDAPQSSHPWRENRWVLRFLRWGYISAVSLIGIGVVLRCTVQDRWPGLASLYYATPWGAIAVGCIGCLFYDAFWRPARAPIWLLLLIWVLPVWGMHDWKLNGPRPPLATPARTGELSLVFWNVARRSDLSTAAAYLRRAAPDVIALVEAIAPVEDARAFWKQQLPDYDLSILGGGMQLLTREPSGETTAEDLSDASGSRWLRVSVRGVDYLIAVIDIDGDILRSRRQDLQRLAELADAQAGERVVILGDFNTPTDSVHFAPLRRGHKLLFDEAGRGYRPTWPAPAPVLDLDQIWINNQLEALACWHGWSTASDHRPVHGVVRVRE